MPKFRVGTFNVENLFGRPKVFNLADHTVGDAALVTITELEKLLEETTYTASIKDNILKKYNAVKAYVSVSEERKKLFRRYRGRITGVTASGKDDWDGSLMYKPAKIKELPRKNTAKVIKDIKADILCMVEVENRKVLTGFNGGFLNYRYKYNMLIDGNDKRGIDVGLYSKFPPYGIWSHIYDGTSKSKTFSRDCLEVEVILPDGTPLYILCNHFKSRGYGAQATSDSRRRRQAERVRDILSNEYKLRNELVIVAGDLNDSPTRSPHTLKPLLSTRYLYDVLELEFQDQWDKRWTYHYNTHEQIDYLLVSKPLKDAFVKAGVERRGMYNLSNLSGGQEKSYPEVTGWRNAASDHGAVWADFDL